MRMKQKMRSSRRFRTRMSIRMPIKCRRRYSLYMVLRVLLLWASLISWYDLSKHCSKYQASNSHVIHSSICRKYSARGITPGYPTIHSLICKNYLASGMIPLALHSSIVLHVKKSRSQASGFWLSHILWNLAQLLIIMYNSYHTVRVHVQVHRTS